MIKPVSECASQLLMEFCSFVILSTLIQSHHSSKCFPHLDARTCISSHPTHTPKTAVSSPHCIQWQWLKNGWKPIRCYTRLTCVSWQTGRGSDAVRLHCNGALSGTGSKNQRLKVNTNTNGLKEDCTAAIRAFVLIIKTIENMVPNWFYIFHSLNVWITEETKLFSKPVLTWACWVDFFNPWQHTAA